MNTLTHVQTSHVLGLCKKIIWQQVFKQIHRHAQPLRKQEIPKSVTEKTSQARTAKQGSPRFPFLLHILHNEQSGEQERVTLISSQRESLLWRSYAHESTPTHAQTCFNCLHSDWPYCHSFGRKCQTLCFRAAPPKAHSQICSNLLSSYNGKPLIVKPFHAVLPLSFSPSYLFCLTPSTLSLSLS